MLTFLVLALAMQCFIQRQQRAGRVRMALAVGGWSGLCAAALVSIQADGLECGSAAWLFSLMAAGLTAPFIAQRLVMAKRAWASWNLALPVTQRAPK